MFRACATCLQVQTVEVYLLRAGSTSSLVHAMGISSSAIPLMMPPTNLLASNLLNEQSLNYWNLWDYKQSLLSFIDGGKWVSASCICKDAAMDRLHTTQTVWG
jgi:hypothetical protein